MMMQMRAVKAGARVLSQLITGVVATSLIVSATVIPAIAADSSVMTVSVTPEPKQANGKNVQARILIDAPPSMVWQTITNYPEMRRIIPGYEKSSLIKSNGSSKQLDIAMKVAPFLPTYKYQVQVREMADSQQITLNRISGDFKELRATYKLTPQSNGNKTLLSYTLNIDPGYNLPGSQAVIKSNTERSLKALESHIEAEARKSLIGQR